jgi:hypothetical protein
VIDHDGKKAIYDLVHQKYYTVDQYIDEYIKSEENPLPNEVSKMKKKLSDFILNPKLSLLKRVN